MNIAEAVGAPRVHSQWLPDAIIVEPESLTDSVQLDLQSRGHTITPYNWGHIGSANGIQINDDGYLGGPDPRRENATVGY